MLMKGKGAKFLKDKREKIKRQKDAMKATAKLTKGPFTRFSAHQIFFLGFFPPKKKVSSSRPRKTSSVNEP